MKAKSHLERQPVEFSPTGSFDQDLQTCGPQRRLPGLDAGNPWRQLVLQQFPGAPPRGQALSIQPTPTRAQGATQASIQQQGIEQLAMLPDIRQWAPRAGTQQSASSTLVQRFMATSICQRTRYTARAVGPLSSGGCHAVNTKTQPAKNSVLFLGWCPFLLCPLPAELPGVVGLFVRQTVGMHPGHEAIRLGGLANPHGQGADDSPVPAAAQRPRGPRACRRTGTRACGGGSDGAARPRPAARFRPWSRDDRSLGRPRRHHPVPAGSASSSRPSVDR